MNNNFEKLFSKLEEVEPSKELRRGILARIDFEKRRSARIRLAFFGFIAMASFIAMIPSFQYIAREFSQSGFYQYFSLIFYDGDAVLSSWKEFALSLAETIPAMEITIFLAVVLSFLISIKLAVRNVGLDYKLKLI